VWAKDAIYPPVIRSTTQHYSFLHQQFISPTSATRSQNHSHIRDDAPAWTLSFLCCDVINWPADYLTGQVFICIHIKNIAHCNSVEKQ
jgi:hypothetical protein